MTEVEATLGLGQRALLRQIRMVLIGHARAVLTIEGLSVLRSPLILSSCENKEDSNLMMKLPIEEECHQ